MSLASLLRRAAGMPAPAITTSLPYGTPVRRDIAGLEPLVGRVVFHEPGPDGWVYWQGADGHIRASKPDAIKEWKR